MNFLWFNGSFYWKKFLWCMIESGGNSILWVHPPPPLHIIFHMYFFHLNHAAKQIWSKSKMIDFGHFVASNRPAFCLNPSTFLLLCFSVWKELSSVSTTNTAAFSAQLSHHLHQHTQTAGIIQNRDHGPLGFLWFGNLVKNVHKINKGEKDLSDVMRGILYFLPQLPY